MRTVTPTRAPTRTDVKTAWKFRMFIVGRDAPHSEQAIRNLRRVLDRHLAGQYGIDVIDLRDHPELAAQEQLIVIPAVIRQDPKPPVRVTGDFSDEAHLISAFGLKDALDAPSPAEGGRHG